MKTILEIQKLDRQIRILLREVDKCPASIDFKNYKKILQEGKTRFEQLEQQANEVLKMYDKMSAKYSKTRGEADIFKKQCTSKTNSEDVASMLSEANSMSASISEQNRIMEELVRKADEIVRKTAELSNKLTEIKMKSGSIKAKIEQKKQEVAPKIAELEKKIAELEPKVEDKEKYEKYKDMKERGIFPVFVTAEDNFCGGCKVELPLNFMEKLKTKKFLPCEHCGRIIMFN